MSSRRPLHSAAFLLITFLASSASASDVQLSSVAQLDWSAIVFDFELEGPGTGTVTPSDESVFHQYELNGLPNGETLQQSSWAGLDSVFSESLSIGSNTYGAEGGATTSASSLSAQGSISSTVSTISEISPPFYFSTFSRTATVTAPTAGKLTVSVPYLVSIEQHQQAGALAATSIGIDVFSNGILLDYGNSANLFSFNGGNGPIEEQGLLLVEASFLAGDIISFEAAGSAQGGFSVAPVPVPGALLLFCSGLLGIARIRNFSS